MKKLLTLLFMCITMMAQATYVLWVGVNENAVVNAGDNTFSIPQFANIVGQPMENMGGRILVGGEAMIVGFEDPNQVADPSLIPAGQTAPSIVWETVFEGEKIGPYTDFELGVVDENYNVIPGMYADWTPIKISDGEPTWNAETIFELGYWDNDWNFIPLASSDSVLLNNLDNEHIYETGSLAPPVETPWKPIDFYTDYQVPEPSITILTILGTCILLLKRKKNMKGHK